MLTTILIAKGRLVGRGILFQRTLGVRHSALLCRLLENSCDIAPMPPPALHSQAGKLGQASLWPKLKRIILVSGETKVDLM